MRRVTRFALLMFAAALVPLPGGADERPEVCGDREILLEEDEVLVERTLYFHGQAQVGNLDGAQDANIEGTATRLTMDPDPPTSDTDKVRARTARSSARARRVRSPRTRSTSASSTSPRRTTC